MIEKLEMFVILSDRKETKSNGKFITKKHILLVCNLLAALIGFDFDVLRFELVSFLSEGNKKSLRYEPEACVLNI